MNCKYHKDRQSEYVCGVCNQPICEDCMSTINGKKVCHNCIEVNLFRNKKNPGYISKFWSFIFSLIPGCGQMYMGLMNRGLQLLTAFVGILILGIITEGVIVTLGIIVWFYSFFDSLNLRKQILHGEMVKDNAIYELNLYAINRKYLGYAFIAIGGLTVLKNTTSFMARSIDIIFNNRFPTYWIHDLYRNAIPLTLLIIGILLIRRAKRGNQNLKESIEDENLPE